MTAKQYFNNAVCEVIERWTLLQKGMLMVARAVVPSFLSVTYFRSIRRRIDWRELAALYVLVFTVTFVAQMVLAGWNGRLFPDDNPLTKNFFEDVENLLNYSIVCELYIVVGYIFLKHTYFFGLLVNHRPLYQKLNVRFSYEKRYASVAGAVLVILSAFIIQSGYASEVQGYAHWYWFMESGPPSPEIGLAGYFYFFVNLLLLLFVLWVAVAHFHLFEISFRMADGLRAVVSSDAIDRDFWTDTDHLKEDLAPFAWHTVTSKAFVLILTVNMFTWKMNEKNVALMYEMAVIAIAIFGIWIFAIPRYFIQFQIFSIWKKLKVHEYTDLRMPMVLGASALMDLVLITILIKALLGDAAEKFFDRLFS